MTLTTLTNPIAWPGLCFMPGQPTLTTAATLDASGEYVSYVICAKENMTISHVGFRAGTATGSPTCEVRIETVDAATGLPTGTLWATNTNGTTGTITSNSNVLQALTASASITKGQIFCVMVKYATGTSQVIQQTNNLGFVPSSVPYQVFNTGTPTKGVISANIGTVALGSSSTTFYYVPGLFPVSSSTANTFNNTSSAKRGMRFTIPFNCRAVGLKNYQNTAVGDFNAILCTGDASGTELSSSSTAFEGDQNLASNAGSAFYYFDNPVTLTAGTAYRIVIEPTSATNCNIWTVTPPSADYFTATPGGGAAAYTTYVASTWTDSTTQIPFMDLLIDQIDDGAGSGTGVVGVIGG